MTADKKPATDWEAIEALYRAGVLSVSEIARQHGVSHTAINKRAKREGWIRDLAEKVRQEVSARLVSEGVSAETARETIKQQAEVVITLLREHRTDIGANRDAVKKLIAELHSAIENLDEIEEAIKEETAGDKSNKRRDRMMAAVALPSRANVAATLATALKTLVALERQAFNIDDKAPADPDETPMGGTVTHKLSPEDRELLKRLVE